MIPRAYIDEWRATAPWSQAAWVEQDLIISRALVEVFRLPAIAERLAFRGGTALYKFHLHPAARYSEDIDLVQVTSSTFGWRSHRVLPIPTRCSSASTAI